MTPAAAIAALDRQLAAHGQTVEHHAAATVTPGAGTSLRAFVRGARPDEMVGDLKQSDRKVTLSPSASVSPLVGHRLVIGGKTYRVEQPPEEVRMDDTVVRINLVARG